MALVPPIRCIILRDRYWPTTTNKAIGSTQVRRKLISGEASRTIGEVKSTPASLKR